MARPTKPAAESRSQRAEIRLTPRERRQVREEAKAQGLTMADLFRKAIGLPAVNAGPGGNG